MRHPLHGLLVYPAHTSPNSSSVRALVLGAEDLTQRVLATAGLRHTESRTSGDSQAYWHTSGDDRGKDNSRQQTLPCSRASCVHFAPRAKEFIGVGIVLAWRSPTGDHQRRSMGTGSGGVPRQTSLPTSSISSTTKSATHLATGLVGDAGQAHGWPWLVWTALAATGAAGTVALALLLRAGHLPGRPAAEPDPRRRVPVR